MQTQKFKSLVLKRG